jgi:hypothetical protein
MKRRDEVVMSRGSSMRRFFIEQALNISQNFAICVFGKEFQQMIRSVDDFHSSGPSVAIKGFRSRWTSVLPSPLLIACVCESAAICASNASPVTPITAAKSQPLESNADQRPG